MLKWHPDLHHGDPEHERVAHERAVSVNLAFEYLSNLLDRSGSIMVPAGGAVPGGWPSEANVAAARSRTTTASGFPASVFEVYVQSSNIFSIGYDRLSQTLYVKFYRRGHNNGYDIYRYFAISEALFGSLLAAESKGRFLHSNIAQSYRYERY